MIPLTQMPDRTHATASLNVEVADFRRSGQSQGAGPMRPRRAVVTASALVRNFNIEADFLVPLQLHYPAVVDHQLDRAIADGAEGLAELSEERRRQLERIVWAGLGPAGRAA